VNGSLQGYYPATYGFDNDTDGAPPEGWDDQSGIHYINVIPSKYGHNKVLEGYDNGDGGWALFNYFNNTEGTIEFWWAISTIDAGKEHQVTIFNSTLDPLFGIACMAGQIKVNTGGTWQDVPGLTTEAFQWDHVRIDFRSDTGNSYEGLNSNTFRLFYNGIERGTYSFNKIGDPDHIRLYSGWATSFVHGYYDAFGFSWDPSYNVGDNLYEGMPLNFYNNTSLDWISYSLDEQNNITIFEQEIIPLPEEGTHSIQLFGQDTLSGEIIESEIRYFTVDILFDVDVSTLSFSLDEFNVTLSVYNETGYSINFATIHMWWDGNDISSDVQNLGTGYYFVSLDPITVTPGEDPILLNMTVFASGYGDKYFETYIAVDPASLQKGKAAEEISLPLIITISTISVGAIIGLAGIYWNRKRRKEIPEIN
jgi:hypothetical protein